MKLEAIDVAIGHPSALLQTTMECFCRGFVLQFVATKRIISSHVHIGIGDLYRQKMSA